MQKFINRMDSAATNVALFLRWLYVWTVIIAVICGVVVIIVTRFEPGQNLVIATTLLIFFSLVFLAALSDLILRIRRLPSILHLILNSRFANTASRKVEVCGNTIKTVITVVFILGLWLLVFILLCVGIYLLLKGIAALPISTAIILAALVIAYAIGKK